ncbi:MAG: AAA family ATPase [Gemmataceae bacterium]|nr:AAA family ATPase [Gemmataceae bacterium]
MTSFRTENGKPATEEARITKGRQRLSPPYSDAPPDAGASALVPIAQNLSNGAYWAAKIVVGCMLRHPEIVGRMPEFGLNLRSLDPDLHAIAQAAADLHEEGEFLAEQGRNDAIVLIMGKWNWESSKRTFNEAVVFLTSLWEDAGNPHFVPTYIKHINEYNAKLEADQPIEDIARLRGQHVDRGELAVKFREAADRMDVCGQVVDYLPPKFAMRPRTVADIRKTLKPPVFLIDWFLAEGKLAVVGGQEKSWKTSIAMEMAISIDQGVAFLGKFDVPRRRKVVFITIETGEDDLVELHDAICKSKGIDPDATGVLIQTLAPCFDNPADLAELSKWLKREGVEVCFFDPLYLMAIGAGSETKPSDMYAMGRLLTGASQACLSVGCTPVFLHHSSQTANALRKFNKPKLGDLAYAGIREIARQWVLVGHCQEYDSNRGVGNVWICYGGARHRGDFVLEIDEGPTGPGCAKQWETTIKPSTDFAARTPSKDDEHSRRDGAVLAAADRVDPAANGFTENRIFEELKRNKAKMGRVKVSETIARLCGGGFLEPCTFLVTMGKGAAKEFDGYRRSNKHLSSDLPPVENHPPGG